MIRYHATWVVPVSSAPIANGTVAVSDGRIAWVGPRADAPGGEDRDLGDALLMPGLVNTHCHLELTAMRGFLEGLDFRRWIARLTTAKRHALSRALLLDGARYGIVEGLRHGVTTYADTCDSGVALDAMLDMQVRGVMYQEVFGPDPAQRDRSLAELRARVNALRPRETARVRVGVSPHAPYSVSDALFTAVGRYAIDESLPIAIHIAESADEEALIAHAAGPFADMLRDRGIDVAVRAPTPVALLESLGVLAARPLLIHCVRVTDTDIGAIARARCPVAHCPASNAKLAHGVAPLAALRAAGVAVGLGSDSVASNNRMDILEEARLALLMHRATDHAAAHGRHTSAGASLTAADRATTVPDGLTAADALTLATLDGARALGLEREIGSLEPGKAADLAAFPLADLAPTYSPIDAAIFSLGGTRASLVTVDGKELVRDGHPVADTRDMTQSMSESATALSAWHHHHSPPDLR